MHKKMFLIALLLATAAAVFAFDRVVVLEDAYSES